MILSFKGRTVLLFVEAGEDGELAGSASFQCPLRFMLPELMANGSSIPDEESVYINESADGSPGEFEVVEAPHSAA